MPEASSSVTLLNRRSFLVRTGTAAAATVLLAACSDPDPVPPSIPTIALAGGDEGVLHYFLLLVRFADEFYAKVLAAPPTDLPAAEVAVLRDISRHTILHRELLKLAISDNGITLNTGVRDVAFSYDAFTLTTRTGVLAAAQTIDDLITAAHGGMARLWTSQALLGLQMKILAVNARHAATIRDLRTPGSFAAADVVPTTGTEAGLNQVLLPAAVLTELSKYTSPVILAAGSLPTT